MGIKKLKELLAGDYVDNLTVGDTLTMKQAAAPEADGLFVRVNGQGEFVGYRAPNQDIEWSDVDSTDIVLNSEKLILSLTPDQNITTDDGSFQFYCKLDNGSGVQDDNVLFTLKIDDVQIKEKEVIIDRGDTNIPVTFFGSFTQNTTSGQTIAIYASSNKDSIIKGTVTSSFMKVIKARAAEI